MTERHTASAQTLVGEDLQTAIPTDTTLPKAFSLRFSTRGIALALNVIVLLQLTFYSTDVVGLAPGLVGVLFLAAKLFDGFTDLVAGVIIDRTNTRWGKARPYELFIIPLWLLTVAIFSTPAMSTFWQATYIFVLYALINSVCATFLNASEAVYLKRSVRGEVQHAKVLSRQGVLIIFMAAIGSIMLPQLMASWGTQPGGWTMIALVYGIPFMIIGLIRFFTVKELPEDDTDRVTEERLGLGATVRALFQNKFVFIFTAMVLLANIVIAASAIVGTYYFTYILGNVGLMSLVSAAGILVPVVYLLFPLAVRTIGAMNFARIGLVLAIVGYLMVFLAPRSLPMVVIGQVLGSFTTVITMLVAFFMIQAMTYGEWKTGKRIDAVTNSLSSFASKVGSGLASALVGFAMAAVGYDGTLGQQSAAAESAIIQLYSLMPLLVSVAMLGLSFFYTLEKHIPAIQRDLAAGVHASSSTLTVGAPCPFPHPSSRTSPAMTSTMFHTGWTFRRTPESMDTPVVVPHDAMIGEQRSAHAGAVGRSLFQGLQGDTRVLVDGREVTAGDGSDRFRDEWRRDADAMIAKDRAGPRSSRTPSATRSRSRPRPGRFVRHRHRFAHGWPRCPRPLIITPLPPDRQG